MAEEKKKKEELNYQFVSLVFSLQQAAMAQLGKIANPATGKMEKNLAQAKATVDMLEMLKEKSKGNLTETEQKIVLNTLDNLYLNYADEVEKPVTTEGAEKTTEATEKPAEGAEKKPATTETAKETAKPAEEKPATTEATEKPVEGAEKPVEGARRNGESEKRGHGDTKKEKTTEGARRNGESEKRGHGDTEKEKPAEGAEKKEEKKKKEKNS